MFQNKTFEMSTSNVIDLDLDDSVLPVPRFFSASPVASFPRYIVPKPSRGAPEIPSPQIVAEILNAARQGDLRKVTHYGAAYDLNAGDYDTMRCPIHDAAAEGQVLIVKFLILKGVDVNCEDRQGNTPLVEALRGNHYEAAKMLREAGAKQVNEYALWLEQDNVLLRQVRDE